MNEKELNALDTVLAAARTLCQKSRLVVQDVHGNGRPVPDRGLLERLADSSRQTETSRAMHGYEIDLLRQLPSDISAEDLARAAAVLNRLCSRLESREWSDLVAKW